MINSIIAHIIPNCHLEHRDASASMMTFVQTLVKLTASPKKENKVNEMLERFFNLSVFDLDEERDSSVGDRFVREIRSRTSDRFTSGDRPPSRSLVDSCGHLGIALRLENVHSGQIRSLVETIARRSASNEQKRPGGNRHCQTTGTVLSQLVRVSLSLPLSSFVRDRLFSRSEAQPSTIEDQLQSFAKLYR